MKYLVAIIVVLVILFTIPTKTTYIHSEPTQIDNLPMIEPERDFSVIGMINELAPRFGQDPALIEKITWCESNHKVAVHDGGAGKGVTGFHKSTFDFFLKKYEEEYGETLNYDSSYDQIKLMSYVFSLGETERRLWTTYRAYTNDGKYSFYSRVMQMNYVVICK